MQDTPGYGDDQDISKHIELIVEHINAQNIKWLEMEQAKDRCVLQHWLAPAVQHWSVEIPVSHMCAVEIWLASYWVCNV